MGLNPEFVYWNSDVDTQNEFEMMESELNTPPVTIVKEEPMVTINHVLPSSSSSASSTSTSIAVPHLSSYYNEKKPLVIEKQRLMPQTLAQKKLRPTKPPSQQTIIVQQEKMDINKFSNLQRLLTHLHISGHLTSTQFLNLKQITDDDGPHITKSILNSRITKGSLKVSPVYRRFLMVLHFYCPKAFEYIKTQYDFRLPQSNTINSWYRSVNFKSGFTVESFTKLKEAVTLSEIMGKFLVGNLIVDQIQIAHKIEFDGYDEVGYVYNFNENDYLYNADEAKEMLVFVFVSVIDNWALPLGYFPIDDMTAQQKNNLIRFCMENVISSGVDLIGVTFNATPTNITVARMLKCGMDWNNFEPSFVMGQSVFLAEEKQLLLTLDPVHAFQLIYNTFAVKKKLWKPEDGEVIDWRYIESLERYYETGMPHDDTGFLLICIKNIKLAIQTLSISVADAIDYCCNTLHIDVFQGADATVEFIRFINNSFDVLNSHKFSANGYKKSLSLETCNYIIRFTEDAIEYLSNLKIVNQTTSQLVYILKTSRKTGFMAFVLGLMNIKYINQKYIETQTLTHFSTSSLSRSKVDQIFNFNTIPTTLEFMQKYKSIIENFSSKTFISNSITVAPISSTSPSSGELINETVDKYLLTTIKTSSSHLSSQLIDHEYIFNNYNSHEYIENVVNYITNYIVCHLTEYLKCEMCINCLHIIDPIYNHVTTNVYQICYLTEIEYQRYRKSLNSLYLKSHQTSKEYIILKIAINTQNLLINRNILQSFGHLEHVALIRKVIIEKYLFIRMFYANYDRNNVKSSVMSRLKLLLVNNYVNNFDNEWYVDGCEMNEEIILSC